MALGCVTQASPLVESGHRGLVVGGPLARLTHRRGCGGLARGCFWVALRPRQRTNQPRGINPLPNVPF
jgi:hypothetical protein